MTNNKIAPQDYHRVTPSLIFQDATKAIEYYKKIFDAKVKYHFVYDNRVVHAEIKIGDSIIMLSDAMNAAKTGQDFPDLPFLLYVYVQDVDDIFKRAIESGSQEIEPVDTKSYGDRVGIIRDPFGYKWAIATNLKYLTEDELKTNLPNYVKEMAAINQDKYLDKYLKYKQKYLDLKKKINN